MRSYFEEGIGWLRGAMDRRGASSPDLRAKALNALGVLLMSDSRYPEARTALEEALHLRRESGNEAGVAETLNSLANMLREQNQPEEAEHCYNESLELRRKLQDARGIAGSLNNLGILARERKDLAKAKTCFEESLQFYAQYKDHARIAATLINIGVICQDQEDYDGARGFYEQALAIYQQQKNRSMMAHILYNLGSVAILQQGFMESLNYFTQSVCLRWELGVEGDVVSSLLGIANLLVARGQWVPAAVLLGVIHRQQQNDNVLLDALDQQDFAIFYEATLAAIAAETFARKYAQGQEMPLRQAVRHILEGDFDSL